MSTKVLKPPTTAILKSTPSRAQIHNEAITCKLSKQSMSANSDTPSPMEFDKFLPWVCLRFEITIDVTVKKAVAEKYVSRRKISNICDRKVSSDRLNSSDRKAASHQNEPSSKKIFLPSDPVKLKSGTPSPSDKIPIVAYYDHSGHLVEVAIVKSPVKIDQKAIKCINMCLPFHPSLLKFTITKGGLSSEVLYEVAKMLPLSFITDVCIDDCYIKEGNYYSLLDNISPLKVLSLKRCKINDLAFKEIIKRIDLGQTASGLTVLDLGSNLITDKGVWYLGDVLRRNRSLLHLCLSNNKITNMGVKYIMNALMEFQMSQEEIFGMRKRRFQFVESIEITKLEKGDDHNKHDSSNQGTQVHFHGKVARKKSLKKKKQSTQDLYKVSAVSVLERVEFTDVFDDHNVVVRDGIMYCIGNLTLCSLNLAYNELDFIAVKKIFDVVHYQSKIVKLPPRTGLMRLVLEGNLIPNDCDELHEIGMLLSFAIETASQTARILKSRCKF